MECSRDSSRSWWNLYRWTKKDTQTIVTYRTLDENVTIMIMLTMVRFDIQTAYNPLTGRKTSAWHRLRHNYYADRIRNIQLAATTTPIRLSGVVFWSSLSAWSMGWSVWNANQHFIDNSGIRGMRRSFRNQTIYLIKRSILIRCVPIGGTVRQLRMRVTDPSMITGLCVCVSKLNSRIFFFVVRLFLFWLVKLCRYDGPHKKSYFSVESPKYQMKKRLGANTIRCRFFVVVVAVVTLRLWIKKIKQFIVSFSDRSSSVVSFDAKRATDNTDSQNLFHENRIYGIGNTYGVCVHTLPVLLVDGWVAAVLLLLRPIERQFNWQPPWVFRYWFWHLNRNSALDLVPLRCRRCRREKRRVRTRRTRVWNASSVLMYLQSRHLSNQFFGAFLLLEMEVMAMGFALSPSPLEILMNRRKKKNEEKWFLIFWNEMRALRTQFV